MDEHRIGRRRMLRHAGLVAGSTALATVAIAAPTNADSGDRHASMAGGWKLHREDVFGVYDGIFALATGGAATYQDINPPGPLPVLGVWSESGRRFRWEIWSGFDADPASDSPASTAQVVGQGTRTDQSFTSTYTTSFFDAATGALLGAVDGTATGTRFQV